MKKEKKKKEKSIKQGYNARGNYAVSYFSFVGFADTNT